MSIIIFIIILSVLVFVHELGHFLFAKWSGTKVHSFAIGFEPTLWKKKVGDTTYKINAIPFGGYVRIHGQDREEELPGKPGEAMYEKPLIAQLGILFGGIFFNLVFAWLLLSATLMLGSPQIVAPADLADYPDATWNLLAVSPGSPASEAGLAAGEELQSLRVGAESYDYLDTAGLATLVNQYSSDVFTFSVLRGEEVVDVEVTPAIFAGADAPRLGLASEAIASVSYPFGEALGQGIRDTQSLTQQTAQAFGQLIRDAVGGNAKIANLAGPVGLVGMTGDAASFGLSYLLFFTALISINLAILNLIPFPALDGGRILFVLIEAVIRRPIPPKIARWINAVGFGILILLMIAVTVSDVIKLF